MTLVWCRGFGCSSIVSFFDYTSFGGGFGYASLVRVFVVVWVWRGLLVGKHT